MKGAYQDISYFKNYIPTESPILSPSPSTIEPAVIEDLKATIDDNNSFLEIKELNQDIDSLWVSPYEMMMTMILLKRKKRELWKKVSWINNSL
jgi:hypothetical protein